MNALRWRKLGKIFDPTLHALPNDCVQFAQSPQALVFDEFIRVYFSTRALDKSNGKFLSHVAFVDLSKDLQRIVRVADEPVIALGGLGCFDEHGIFPMSVLRVGDRVYGYTCGWSRRVSVSVETGIGLAISRDQGVHLPAHRRRSGSRCLAPRALSGRRRLRQGDRWPLPHVVHLRHRLGPVRAGRRA